GFSYFLFLSQDHHLEETLPVKTLAYSQETAKEGSNLAFISGQIQIKTLEDKTHIYAPLTGKQGVYGVLQLSSDCPVTILDMDMEFVMQFANIAGKAIEN